MILIRKIRRAASIIFNVCIGVLQQIPLVKKSFPPRIFPLRLLLQYTMNGRMRIRYYYRNDLCPPDTLRRYTKEEIDSFIEKIMRKEVFYYGATDTWLYQALEKYSIKGKSVAIIGSVCPVYESICIAYGGEPTTIEYNKIISEDERVRVMTVDEYDRTPMQFDAAFSISSIEHDGLGRYGDPLRPDGDILSMKKMKSMVRPDGLLFLSVPVGKDTLLWNDARIYGKFRLPLLLKEWELLDAFGYSTDVFREPRFDSEPVFVLKNTVQASKY